MDDLENKIKKKLESVVVGDSNAVDADIIHLFELKGDQAKLEINWGDFVSDKDNIISKIRSALLTLDEVNVVVIDDAPEPSASGSHSANGGSHPQKAAPDPTKNLYLSQYSNVIAVASGKGGVGKSTVALNLALALKSLNKTVSLFDADIYGPSVPIMLGARGDKPKTINNKILPLSKFGIEFMSIGNLVEESSSVIWRGPMVHQAVEQIIRDTQWPGGDFIIIDLPPGTGDVQITLSQVTSLTGAVIVCTPQDVALLDAAKAISMFEKVNVPILGMIENMSSFVCPKCSAETPIFGVGGCERESKIHDYNFLGRIPIELDVRLCGDNGEPIVSKDPKSPASIEFIKIAENLVEVLS